MNTNVKIIFDKTPYKYFINEINGKINNNKLLFDSEFAMFNYKDFTKKYNEFKKTCTLIVISNNLYYGYVSFYNINKEKVRRERLKNKIKKYVNL